MVLNMSLNMHTNMGVNMGLNMSVKMCKHECKNVRFLIPWFCLTLLELSVDGHTHTQI